MIPAVRGVQDDRKADAAERRAAEALLDGAAGNLPPPTAPEGEASQIDIDATSTMSQEERLKSLDFEQMTTAEVAALRTVIEAIAAKR